MVNEGAEEPPRDPIPGSHCFARRPARLCARSPELSRTNPRHEIRSKSSAPNEERLLVACFQHSPILRPAPQGSTADSSRLLRLSEVRGKGEAEKEHDREPDPPPEHFG